MFSKFLQSLDSFSQSNKKPLDLSIIANSLQDSWYKFLDNLPNIALAILIVVLGYFLAKKIVELVDKRLAKKAQDQLMTRFLTNVIKSLIFFILAIIALQVAGLSSITNFLLTIMATSTVVFGLAFKDIGENFISGVILAFKRPFSINDTIMIDNAMGKVQSLEFRYTKLKAFDGRDIYIPNSDVLRKQVINFTEDGYIRYEFVVSLNPKAEVDKVYDAIQQIIDSHKDVVHKENFDNYIAIDEITTNYINLKVFFWVETIDFRKAALIARGNVIRDVNHALDEVKEVTSNKPTT